MGVPTLPRHWKVSEGGTFPASPADFHLGPILNPPPAHPQALGIVPLLLLDSGMVCGRKPSLRSSHPPWQRGDPPSGVFSMDFRFFPSEMPLVSSNRPPRRCFGVRPHKTSPAFLWVLFPHSCFPCTTTLPSGTIPASQGGHPCLSSPGHPTGNVSTARDTKRPTLQIG